MQPPPPPNEDKFQALDNLVNQQQQQQHQGGGGPSAATGNTVGGQPAQAQQLQIEPVRNLYQPTPKELAYAIYILEQCFPSSLQLFNQSRPGTLKRPISITGQDAVAFLTTSGIHRLILRILWTVVDPNNIGTLIEIGQFHTILRLVALTQAGFVEPELLEVGKLPPPKPTPVQVVWKILNQNTTTVVPLANFNALPNGMPDSQQLQQIYMTLQQKEQQQQQSAQPTAAGGQGGGLMGAGAGAGMMMNPSQQQAAAPMGMAALDALGPATDAPLPALGSSVGGISPIPSAGAAAVATTTATATTADEDDEEEDFGGFAEAPPTGIPMTVNISSQGMAALDDISVTTTATMQTMAGTVNTGTRTCTPPPPPPAAAAAAAAASGMAALDSLMGSATDAPLPGLGVTQPPPVAGAPATAAAAAAATGMAALDVFGSSTDAPLPALGGGGGTTAATTTGLGAFDALGPAANAPLPSLGGFGQQQQQQPSPSPGAGGPATADDDFGGFTDASTPPPPPPADGAVAAPTTTGDDEFGGFTDAPPAVSSGDGTGAGAPTANTMSAFDALGGGTQDAPLPTTLGGGLTAAAAATTATAGDNNAAAASAAAPAGGDVFAMSAFDAIGPAENKPLPSLGTSSGANSHASSADYDDFLVDLPPDGSGGVFGGGGGAAGTDDPNNMSFGSFAGAASESAPTATTPGGGKRRSLNTRRRSSRSISSPETVPKDLMPPMPGEKYVGKVRQNSLRKLPEIDLDFDDNDEEKEHEDPFAGLDPAPSTLELNEPTSLGPEAESMPKDLQPHSPGERYVPHSKNAASTPGGLQTLAEPNFGDEDDEFGGFTEAPAKFPTLPNLDPASEPNPFSESMPQDMRPHAPGEHYVPHSAQANRTPGGLATVGEGAVSNPTMSSLVDMSELNPPTTLSRQETPRPQDLHPHKPGQHYVSHGPAPTGLATVGEAFGELVQVEDTKLPGLGGASAEDDDFGDFSAAAPSAGGMAVPPPIQLSRQATPAAKDLDPLTKKASAGALAGPSIQEGDEEEEDDEFGDFGGFASAGEAGLPPPTQLSRQATPAAKDLDPLTKKTSSSATPLGGATIQEDDEDEEEEDDFGDFAGSTDLGFPGQMEIAPPTQMKRQETPRPQDLRPDLKGGHNLAGQGSAPGLGSVAETIEEDFGSFTQSSGAQAFAPPPMLSRQATPAAKDLELLPRKATVNNNETIFEDEEEAGEEPGFGAFTASGNSDVMPPPAQLSRQATPAAKDLEQLKQKGASGGALEGMAIQEGDEDDEEGDDFGGFESAGMPGQMDLVAPPQMKRKETPRPQDIKPKVPGAGGLSSQPGLAAIGETQDAVAEGAEEDNSENSPDPFAAFDTLAVPDTTLPPLPVHGVGGSTDPAVAAAPSLEAATSLDMFALKRPSGVSRQPSSGGSSIGNLGSKSTASLLDDEDDDEQSAALRDACRSRSRSPMPDRSSKSPIPDRIGVSLSGHTPAIFQDTADAGMDVSGNLSDFGDFGDFAGAPVAEVPAPGQLTRQATPAAHDLDPMTKKASAGLVDTVTIMEEDDEDEAEDDFGGFTEATAGASSLPAPTQLSRQATPAAKDLDPLRKKASAGAVAGAAIQEGEEEEEEEDDFGDFGGFTSATAGAAALPPPTQLSRQATPAAKDLDPLTKKASSGVVAGAAIQEGDEEEEEDDFGDFGGFASAGDAMAPPPTQLSRQATPAAKDLDPLTKKASAGAVAGAAIQEGDEEEEDDFGDFGGFASAGEAVAPPPTQVSRQATPAAKHLDPLTKKSSAGAATSVAIQEGIEEEEDDFGDFGGFASAGGAAVPPPTQLLRQATPAAKDLDPLTKKSSAGAMAGAAIQEGNEDEEEDEFGDFGGFEQGSAPPPTATADDDFGGFAAASATAPAPSSGDDFGDFASFSAAPAPQAAASTSWDAFQDTPSNQTDPVRDQMASLVQQLPAQFIQSFDYDNKLKSLAADKKKRTDRSIQVLSLLTSTSGKLVAIWPQVLEVAREELSLGNRLLDEASGLSSQEQKATQKPLATMVAGMGEYVRATRSIVGALGDMLLLDIATPLSESTLSSSWGSVSLIKKAWEVEKLWKTMHSKSTSLGLPTPTRLETIVEIREKCLKRCPSTRLCNLTLQPLSDEDSQTTKATVDWGGKPFMACSANFLANKCPFYAINDSS